MLPLVLLALLLGACAVRPAPRTATTTPEVTISPSAEAYSVESSSDGVTWVALGETQAATWLRVKRALPPVPPQPAGTRFVDPTITASCTTYNAATRTCGGATAATAYPTWQAAAAVANPGETWFLRGGTYALKAREEIVLSRAGTESQPITWEGYEGESVYIKGPYDTDTHVGATCAAGDGVRDWDEDCNQDAQKHADGPADSGDRASLIKFVGDWNIVRRVRAGWGFRCVWMGGTHQVLEESVLHDCWEAPVGTNAPDSTIRYVAALRGRHRTGIFLNAGSSRTTVYRSLSYAHGQHCTIGDCSARARVRSINGDDSNSSEPGGKGGQNADSFSGNKDCEDTAPAGVGSNLCQQNTWQENIGWDSVDGGFDHSEQGGFWIANIAVRFNLNGGPGMKILRTESDGHFSGNVWWRGGNGARGAEYRVQGGARVLHNLALRNAGHGHLGPDTSGTDNRLANNVGYLDSAEYNTFASPQWTMTNNFDGDKQGNPGLTDDAADPAPALAAAEACVNQAPHVNSVRSCWQTLWNALTAPLKPTAGSPLIDAGVIVPDSHCAKADDDASAPEPATSACRHWRGAAPDQGPFEFGIDAAFNNGSGNPDKSRCAAIGTC
jgi:hypothetical protein